VGGGTNGIEEGCRSSRPSSFLHAVPLLFINPEQDAVLTALIPDPVSILHPPPRLVSRNAFSSRPTSRLWRLAKSAGAFGCEIAARAHGSGLGSATGRKRPVKTALEHVGWTRRMKQGSRAAPPRTTTNNAPSQRPLVQPSKGHPPFVTCLPSSQTELLDFRNDGPLPLQQHPAGYERLDNPRRGSVRRYVSFFHDTLNRRVAIEISFPSRIHRPSGSSPLRRSTSSLARPFSNSATRLGRVSLFPRNELFG